MSGKPEDLRGDLRRAYDATVAANAEVISGLDDAVVTAGRKIADEIDNAVVNLTGQERTKALYLMPHLMNVLKEMLATPASRKAAGLGGKSDAGTTTLGKLRSVHSGKGA